jgi:uncharacterized Fe-S cluster protein YjdI
MNARRSDAASVREHPDKKPPNAAARLNHQAGETTMALKVTWDKDVCIHSANCVKTLPQVFKVEQGKFVIDPSAADDSLVRAAVAACPSKALRLQE